MKKSNKEIGIENATPAVAFIGHAITSIASIDQNGDGKLQTFEIFNKLQSLAIKAFTVNQQISSWKELVAEMKNIDPEESRILVEELAKTNDWNNDKLEWLFEDWLRWFNQGYSLVYRTIDLRKESA